jgi:hypothetical protein
MIGRRRWTKWNDIKVSFVEVMSKEKEENVKISRKDEEDDEG